MVTVKQKYIIDIHTKRKRNPNITLKIVITRVENERRKGKQKDLQKQSSINKMAIGTYLSIITLNVNRLNAPTKRQTG